MLPRAGEQIAMNHGRSRARLRPARRAPLLSGDTFSAYLPLFSDSGGNVGNSAYTKARSSLHADGERIFAVDEPLNGESHTVPAGRAQLQARRGRLPLPGAVRRQHPGRRDLDLRLGARRR